MTRSLGRRQGGAALVAGYLVLLAVLFRDPARVSAVLESTGFLVAFVVLPAVGLASGAYAVAGRPFAGVGLFVMGSYLGIVGLTVGFGLVSVPVGVVVAGFVLFVLALVAVLAGTFAMWAFLSSP